MQSKRAVLVALGVFVAVIVLAIVLVVSILSARKSPNIPFNITVTFGMDVYTQKNFCWYTSEEVEIGYIFYMEDTGDVFDMDKCTKIEAQSEKVVQKYPVDTIVEEKTTELEDRTYMRHRVFVSGLKPGTRYLYRLGEGDNLSDVYTFKTPEQGKDFSFIIVADSQGYKRSDFEHYKRVLDKANDMFGDVDFYIHLGDFVDDGKNFLQWKYVLDVPRDVMANNTFVPVAGNRDDMEVFEYFTLGSVYDTRPMANGYYSFTINDVHFVVLYTAGNKDLPKKQRNFLEDELSKHKDSRVVVLTHKAPYTNANHADDKEIVALREELLPVFDKYGVELVLQGHDHFFFRSEPVYDGKVGSYTYTNVKDGDDDVDMMSDVKGTIYLINSSSGVSQYDGAFRNMDDIHAFKSFNMNNPTFTYCAVTENGIILKTYEVNVMRHKVQIIDSFGIRS
jgi:predicted phosphodiesterase